MHPCPRSQKAQQDKTLTCSMRPVPIDRPAGPPIEGSKSFKRPAHWSDSPLMMLCFSKVATGFHLFPDTCLCGANLFSHVGV